jgi:hypothetical protein
MNTSGETVADNKRWFKVWTTLLVDMIADDIPLEDIGRFTVLGCLLAKKGKKGKIKLTKSTKKTFLKCEKLPEKFMKNFNVKSDETDNDKTIVSLKNWNKYQKDSTGYKRLKEWRKKQNDNDARNANDNADKIKTKKKTKTKIKKKEENNHLFDIFWSHAPPRNGKKIGKAKAEELFNRLNDSEQKLCIKAVRNYADSELIKKKMGIIDPHRILKSRDYPDGLWREWTEPEIKHEEVEALESKRKEYEREIEEADKFIQQYTESGKPDQVERWEKTKAHYEQKLKKLEA